VSLCVRRGDYVSDPKINSVHGICKLEYYCKAIALICVRIEDSYYFIFSDYLKWAFFNIKPAASTIYKKYNIAKKL
jgi:hypothetical protein